MRVLIVDDSVAFRTAIKAVLSEEHDIDIVGSAANGKIALAKMEVEPIDIVIMDLDMPEMDGLETLREMNKRGIQVTTLIYAAPSPKSYGKVAEALKLGAFDFLAKSTPSDHTSGPAAALEAVRKELLCRIRVIESSRPKTRLSIPVPEVKQAPSTTKRIIDRHFKADIVVIASSTGGPMALEKVFAKFKGFSNVPILIVQHMPSYFTKGLAARLGQLTNVACAEGVHGETIKRNRIYVAPGDFHMSVGSKGRERSIVLDQLPQINHVRPAADPLFSTVAELYKDAVLAFVLTGMGEDGKLGAAAVKRFGGGVMIQDRDTSVVWGMPGAVAGIDAFDRIGSIDECAEVLAAVCGN